jgi:hypothetical protein
LLRPVVDSFDRLLSQGRLVIGFHIYFSLPCVLIQATLASLGVTLHSEHVEVRVLPGPGQI